LIVTLVDDAILITKTPRVADDIIKAIQSHNLDLDKLNDGGLAKYLGMNINGLPDGSVDMTQKGLTEQNHREPGSCWCQWQVDPCPGNIGPL